MKIRIDRTRHSLNITGGQLFPRQWIAKKKKKIPLHISFHFVTEMHAIDIVEMEGMRGCIHMHASENTWPRDVWN